MTIVFLRLQLSTSSNLRQIKMVNHCAHYNELRRLFFFDYLSCRHWRAMVAVLRPYLLWDHLWWRHSSRIVTTRQALYSHVLTLHGDWGRNQGSSNEWSVDLGRLRHLEKEKKKLIIMRTHTSNVLPFSFFCTAHILSFPFFRSPSLIYHYYHFHADLKAATSNILIFIQTSFHIGLGVIGAIVTLSLWLFKRELFWPIELSE